MAHIFALLSIALGAFAHHALQGVLTVKELAALQTASRYLFYNAIPLLIIFYTNKNWQWSRSLGWTFIISGTLFSGSIIGLVFTKIKLLAFLTPLGGIGIIGGWVFWLVQVFKRKNS